MLRNLLFYIKEAFLSTKKNGIMSFATIISLTATLLIIGILLLISFNINYLIEGTESELMAVAYLKDQVSAEEAKNIIQSVSQVIGVAEVVYISKDDAFQKLKDDLKEHEDILAGISENPLPSSLEIKVSDSKYLEDIASYLEKNENVEEVNYGGQLTKNLLLIFQFIRKTGLIIISFLIFVSTLIMVSVIKISVHSRQGEIEIMALVGATSWFIRWPFIIEGFLKGLLSALITIFILARFYFMFTEQVLKMLPFIPILVEYSTLVKIAVILLFMGIFIGIFGSMLSLRKIKFEEF